MKEKILGYGRQWITEEDVEAVVKKLHDGALTQGPAIAEFEEKLAEACGAKHAIAVNSGTAALHIACLAANIGEGDEVITSPNTFVASANCAFYCGAKPVFADIESETALIHPQNIERAITSATRAIIPVHFAGQSADMVAISEIAKRASARFGKKVYIIEDAAHALGGTYRGTAVGSCAFSDMTTFSFHPVKHITTGEGGAVLTNDKKLYQRLQLFRSHGITRDPEFVEDTSTAPWGYEQHELGFNYRLTDIQAALGISQMSKLESFIQRRREISAKYHRAFLEMPLVQLLKEKDDGQHAYHLFVVKLPFEKLGGRSSVMMKLREKGLVTQVHYIPVHTQPYYRKKLGTKWGDFPVAENYYSSCLSIPMFPAMTDEDVTRVISEIKNLF